VSANIRRKCGTEGPLIDERSEHDGVRKTGSVIVNAGAVIAVLLGFPSLFIGIFGAVGVITGEKLVAGSLGAVWGYLAVVGAYELNRRKFAWMRGRTYSDLHLLAGTLAVSTGLVISGIVHETMPALALVCALSAIKQANDGHDKKFLAPIHIVILCAGIAGGIWFFNNSTVGKALLLQATYLP
jgi:hypothetical protein